MNKLIYWIPVIAIAVVIFWFSSQPYQEQDVKPFLGDFIQEEWIDQNFSWVEFDYAGYTVNTEKLGATAFLEFFIRKGAHFGIFFLLGFFTYRALIQTLLKGRKVASFIGAILFVFLYAVQDELHQHFTGNRTPLVHDVGIDTVGGFVGILIYIIFRKKR